MREGAVPVKRIGQVLAAVAVVFALLALVSGVRSDPQGRLTAESFGQGFANLWRWLAATVGGLDTVGVAGNAGAAALIALAAFAAIVIFLPGARQGRGLVATGMGAVALWVVLFAPDLPARIGG